MYINSLKFIRSASVGTIVVTTVLGTGYNDFEVIVLLYTMVPNLYKSAGAAQ